MIYLYQVLPQIALYLGNFSLFLFSICYLLSATINLRKNLSTNVCRQFSSLLNTFFFSRLLDSHIHTIQASHISNHNLNTYVGVDMKIGFFHHIYHPIASVYQGSSVQTPNPSSGSISMVGFL